MSDLSGELREIASAFDLGEYEIEAYLAVLEHGELTASGIADATGVPQPRVYDTARSLAERGLVELRESRPMRVVAVDPDDAFGGLQASLSDLVDALEARYTAPTRGAEAATLVRSRTSILRYLREVIERADDELALSLTPPLLEEFETELAAATDRDVSTELVVTPAAEAPDPDAFDYESVATAARARRGITTPVLAVADGQYSVYATQRGVRDGTDDYGVIFNRSALGFLLLGFFGTVVWTTADALLIEDGLAPSFPRRYASIRRCIKDIRTVDATLHATVEGRDVLTGEERVVEGRIASTRFTEDEEVATLRLETDEGPVEVGGRVAAYEDVEAHRIDVERAP